MLIALAYLWFAGGLIGLLIIGLVIAGLADVMGRSDLEGGARIGWIVLIVLLPIAGSLIYLAKRPTSPEERDKIIAAQGSYRR